MRLAKIETKYKYKKWYKVETTMIAFQRSELEVSGSSLGWKQRISNDNKVGVVEWNVLKLEGDTPGHLIPLAVPRSFAWCLWYNDGELSSQHRRLDEDKVMTLQLRRVELRHSFRIGHGCIMHVLKRFDLAQRDGRSDGDGLKETTNTLALE